MPAAGNNTGAGGAKNIAKATAKVRVPKVKPVAAPAPAAPPTPRQVSNAKAQRAAYVSQGKAVAKAAAPPAPPTARQVRHAQVQRAQYVDQGNSVERTANAERTYVRGLVHTRQAQVKDVKSNADISRNPAVAAANLSRRIGKPVSLNTATGHYEIKEARPIIADKHVPVDVFTGKPLSVKQQLNDALKHPSQAAYAAPALKVLDQTTRPLHAIAAAADAQVKTAKEKGVGYVLFHDSPAQRKAAVRGLQLKDRTSFSKVFQDAGLPKPVAEVGGAIADVGFDPTTYAAFGVGSIAKKAAEDAARSTYRKAVAAGMSEDGAKTVAARAAQRAAAAAPDGRGITASFGGHEVPGVRAATAKVGRGGKRVVQKVAPNVSARVSSTVRDVAREVRPTVRPAGVSEQDFQAARAAARKARATVNNTEQRAMKLASNLRKSIPEKDYQQVVNAIERDDLSGLSPELASSAHDLRSALKGMERQRRRAGVASDTTARVGQTGSWLSSSDLKKLRRTVNAEPKAARRSLQSVQKKALHAQGRAEIASKYGTADAPRALARLERKRGDVLAAEQRVTAAKGIPTKGLVENDEQYLKRVSNYAKTHNLKLLDQRATKLFASKPTDVAKGYFPRDFDERVLKQLGLSDKKVAAGNVTGGQSRTVSPITSGYKRSDTARIDVVNPAREAAGQAPFSTNVPLVALNHLKKSGRAVSQGQFAQEMAKLGRTVKSADELKPNESLYKLGYQGGTFGLHAVKDVPKRPKSGQYVALDEKVLKDVQASTQQVRGDTTLGRGVDKATGGFKRLAIGTPGFHIRNLVGDTQQAYLAQAGHEMPGNIKAAATAVRRDNQLKKGLRPSESSKTIKVAGADMPVDEFLKGAHANGVTDAGYIGRELHDLTGQAAGKSKQVRRGAGQTIDRWMSNRENLMRLATYKAGLDRGLSQSEAADLANLFHIDYGDLSKVEQTALRRVFPFYTWTSRTLPLYARTLATRPGKLANIEKLREDIGAAATGENEQQQRGKMTDAQQRQVPFVLRIGGGDQAISASLPVTLLNELPTGASGKDLNAYLGELGKLGFQMLNPYLKVPIELQTGVSTYTRRPIEDPRKPLVAAPSWVAHLPDAVKKQLDVTPDFIDKRTGKKTWGWRGKADYASRLIPGAPQQVSTIASGGRAGQPSSTAATAAGALGIRVDSLGAAQSRHASDTRIYKKLADLNRRAAELNQQGITSANATPEYKALRDQINALTKQVGTGKGKPKSSGGGMPIFKGAAGGSGSSSMPIFR